MLSQLTGLPVLFVRKKAQGLRHLQIAEGGRVRGRRLLIVEDVVTSGGAILDAAKALREEGAELGAVVCVIDRDRAARRISPNRPDLTALFTMSELKNVAAIMAPLH